jgi:hypothetical protein
LRLSAVAAPPAKGAQFPGGSDGAATGQALSAFLRKMS